ncbi:unnamed protein product [Arctogadus glacialis]
MHNIPEKDSQLNMANHAVVSGEEQKNVTDERRTATPSGGMGDQQVISDPQRRNGRPAGEQRHPAAGRETSSGSRVRTV